MVPADLRPIGWILLILFSTPASIDSAVDRSGVPAIYIKIRYVVIDLSGAALCSEHVEQLILGIPALDGGSIAGIARLIIRVHVRRHIYACTLWRITAVGLRAFFLV